MYRLSRVAQQVSHSLAHRSAAATSTSTSAAAAAAAASSSTQRLTSAAHHALCPQHHSTPIRSIHSNHARLNEEDDAAARIAAHKERMRLKKLKSIEEAEQAAANPQPAETAAESSTESSSSTSTSTDSTAASDSTSDASSSSSSSSSSVPTQSQVNRVWAALRSEVHHLVDHLEAKKAKSSPTIKKAKIRPHIQKSTLKEEEWSSDPQQLARVEAEKQQKEAEADDEAQAAYSGPTALQAIETETVWDKRISSMREKLRFLGVAVPKKIIRSATSNNEKLSEFQSKLENKLEDAREEWETSQDPRVWKMRDMVDKVTGETETGMALGEIIAADPYFDYLDFLRDMEEIMIPEVVQAFRVGDMRLLKSVTEGTATMEVKKSLLERENLKFKWDDRILDIRAVDIVKAGLHDGVPYIQLTFVCQHVAATYHTDPAKLDELVDPSAQSVVNSVYYSWALRRDYESPYYDWKIFEFQAQQVHALVV